MPRRTLLLLGGSRYAVPVIEAAHELGARVVTCDYLPGNYAHRFSDGYVNASVTDCEAVLAAARRVRADGIMSFATDPGVVAAAYAAERLGLPFQGPLSAVATLQNKVRFRALLRENGFACPWSRSFASVGEAEGCAGELPYPVVVKPADSAGSKGVSRVDGPAGMGRAVEAALAESRSGSCIVEECVECAGCPSDSDCFCVDGSMTCVSFTEQRFDGAAPNPLVPVGYVMPARMPSAGRRAIAAELQRLCALLGLRDGVFNVEARMGVDGRAYLMEVSPRGGGNRLSELLRRASGTDLVRASVLAALGLRAEGVGMPRYRSGVWYEQVVHATRDGVFGGVSYAPGFREEHVVEEQLWVRPGGRVRALTGANRSFGTVLYRFSDYAELDEFLAEPGRFVRVEVR